MSVNFIATPDLPVVTLAATGEFVGIGAEFTLPSLQFSGTLSTGLSAAFVLPGIDLAAALKAGRVLDAEFALPRTSLAATLLAQSVFSAEVSLPVLRLQASVLTGRLLSGQPSLPVLVLSGTLLPQASFSAAFNLPVSQLEAELLAGIVEAFRTWVLNTRKATLTEYDFEFNSYALFNGVVLAAGSGGIVALGVQAQDNATNIDALVRVGKSDYGTSHLKRVPRLYTGLSADGPMLFRTITSETGTRTYRLPYNHVVGYQQRRVPIGKGPKARYWQYEIANEDGADFSIQDILAYPTKLRRRVQ